MSRKKKRMVVLEEEPEERGREETDFITPEEEAEFQEQEKQQELLTEFQKRFADQPAKVLVEKYDQEGDWAICRKYPLQSFEQEQVKAEFGGGRYRGTLMDPGGKYVKGGRINFKFAEKVTAESAVPRPENPLQNPVVVMMLESMKQQQASVMELTKSMIAAQASAPKGGLGEVVEVMKSLNSMTPKDKPMDSFKETLGIMKLFKEVTGDGEGESKGGLLSDVKEFLEIWPTLKDQLAQIKPPIGGAPGGTPAIGQPQIEGQKQDMDPLTKKVVELVPKFIGGAQSNAPAGEWGAYLLDVFDTEVLPLLLPMMKQKYGALVKDEDDVYDIMLRLAKDDTERATIFKQIPPLAPYQNWVLQVLDEAVKLAETPDAEESPAVSGGGSAILTEVAANGFKKES